MEQNANSLYLLLLSEKQSLKLPNMFDVWINSSTVNVGNRRDEKSSLPLLFPPSAMNQLIWMKITIFTSS